jgi:hypothetical protein
MCIFSYLLAIATLVAAAVLTVVLAFDSLTLEFTRKARPLKQKKNETRKGNLQPEPDAKPVHELSEGDKDFVISADRVKEISAQIDEITFQEEFAGEAGINPPGREDEEQSYRDRFLVSDGVQSRVTTAINRDTHRRMKKLLSVAAPEVSIVSYINNILAHHLEQFEDVIGKLYEEPLSKLRRI